MQTRQNEEEKKERKMMTLGRKDKTEFEKEIETLRTDKRSTKTAHTPRITNTHTRTETFIQIDTYTDENLQTVMHVKEQQ